MQHSTNTWHRLAGSDTSATAIRSTFLFLLTSPIAYSRLRAEIDDAHRENRIHRPVISDAEANALPYLQACVKEGLRMWPPVTGLLEKEVPAGGDTLNGFFVPGGTKIGFSAWGLQRKKDIYGQDANLYRPERWLEASERQLIEMTKVHQLIFGYGRWSCLGKTVALMELNKVFAEVRPGHYFHLQDAGAVLSHCYDSPPSPHPKTAAQNGN